MSIKNCTLSLLILCLFATGLCQDKCNLSLGCKATWISNTLLLGKFKNYQGKATWEYISSYRSILINLFDGEYADQMVAIQMPFYFNCTTRVASITANETKKTVKVRYTFFHRYVKAQYNDCLLYTSPSPRDRQKSRMPSSA
eukprot:TRINITY_DN13481_c0_g1_i3.p1 TRINITY_DN13481_c0_g1~~TRINITY_DN13481_c0_g1_i3.p1  ORF type:complete len:142 (-),score=6.82 TRINITY_DN13481_c0_g1_i3:10-435(-)